MHNKLQELEKKCESLQQRIEELTKVESDFHSFLENTSDFVYIKDTQHRFTALSNTFAKLTNHNNWKEIVGKTDFDIFPKEHAEIYYREQVKVLTEGKHIVDIEEPYNDENGNLHWVSTSKRPIYKNREIVGLIGISRDITDRKNRELEHLENIKQLESRMHLLDEQDNIITMCSYCKNIRNENSIWIKAETFIQQLTGYKFSHGICPDCLMKEYKKAGININPDNDFRNDSGAE